MSEARSIVFTHASDLLDKGRIPKTEAWGCCANGVHLTKLGVVGWSSAVPIGKASHVNVVINLLHHDCRHTERSGADPATPASNHDSGTQHQLGAPSNCEDASKRFHGATRSCWRSTWSEASFECHCHFHGAVKRPTPYTPS